MSGDDVDRRREVLHRSFGEHGVPRALEDLPVDSRDKLVDLASVPEKLPLWERILDEVANAGLDSYGDLQTVHIPIVDMHNPTMAQVVQLLDLLTVAGAPRTYLHCEAGKCRTGVMVACYRMAVMGWNETDAFTEAENFDCSVPLQRAFIEQFATQLQARDEARGEHRPDSEAKLGRYPLKPPGSVRATPAERGATLAAVGGTEKGGVE